MKNDFRLIYRLARQGYSGNGELSRLASLCLVARRTFDAPEPLISDRLRVFKLGVRRIAPLKVLSLP